jgi:hypothetical protein
VLASRAAKERAQLEREREVQREKIHRVIDREMGVVTREKAAARKEAEVELKERTARHTINAAKTMAKMIDNERAALSHQEQELSRWEAAAKEEEDRLSALWTDLVARTRDLKVRETKVEGSLAEQRAGVKRIVKWVGEASTTLETLGLSPIQVVEAPSSLGVVLRALDSVAERLQRLEPTLVTRQAIEGRELARVVADYVLTCFRSHDPVISLTPVLEDPVPEAKAVAQEGVQEAVEIVAARFERNTGPDL